MKKYAFALTGLVFAVSAAHAQPAANETVGTPAPATRAVPAEPAEDATPEAPAATVEVSDADIESFAKVTVELQAIQADTSIAADQKQVKMQAVVTDAGLDAAKYNAIGKAAQADQALRTRIQTAMAKHAEHTDG